jgi:hypothetical protein
MRKRCCSNQSVMKKMRDTRIRARRFVRAVNRGLALLLLLSVTGLSTLAKINWYLPQSNPGHYLTTATKMKVAHAASLNTDALHSVRKLVPSPQPEIGIFAEERRETSIPRMLLTVILLHRSPPSESA